MGDDDDDGEDSIGKFISFALRLLKPVSEQHLKEPGKTLEAWSLGVKLLLWVGFDKIVGME